MAGRIITMALDSVDYSEEKACKILEIVLQDDKGNASSAMITRDEIQHEVKGDVCVDNETAAPLANLGADSIKASTETAPDAVDHAER